MALSVTVKLDKAVLDRLVSRLPGETADTVRRHALAVEARARATAPRDTGALANSHTTERDGPYAYRVAAGAEYAADVHGGTRAHLIAARNARALRFVAGGRTLFRRAVRHPGTRANPWLERALEAERAPFERDIADLAERAR